MPEKHREYTCVLCDACITIHAFFGCVLLRIRTISERHVYRNTPVNARFPRDLSYHSVKHLVHTLFKPGTVHTGRMVVHLIYYIRFV